MISNETAIEQLAQWLHDEVDYPAFNFPDHSWPTHADDTGQRGDGWLKIVPPDVCEQFRDIARRLLATRIARTPADGPEPVAITMLEALQYYAKQYCEGMCRELSDRIAYNDCDGCRARLAITQSVPADGPAGEAGDLIERITDVIFAHLKAEGDDRVTFYRQVVREAIELAMPLYDAEAAARLAALQQDRDGWLKIVGDIAALVPIPQVIKVTGTTGDLIAWLKEQVALASSLQRRVEELTGALTEIARQKLVDELSDDEHENADYAGGYEGCVNRARAALTPPEQGGKP